MTDVVVLGSGYGGTGATKSIRRALDGEVDLTWVSDVDHHLVLHEAHRCIRDPGVAETIAIPIGEIKAAATDFLRAEVVGVDTDDRVVELADGPGVTYDYLVVAIGTRTAHFGIPGLRENALTLERLSDALDIHDAVSGAVDDASGADPARVVVGGAGLSGIQVAGEIAAFRDDRNAPLEVHLVEGLDEVYPPGAPDLQDALRRLLEDHGVHVKTGEFISGVDESAVSLGGTDEEPPAELPYDVLVWTGGITGRPAAENTDVERDERNHRLRADATFRTSDERVFAVGDAALIRGNDEPVPPTAQAAWQAATVVGENVERAIHGRPLKRWEYDDKGTLISVGEDAIAHDVAYAPVRTFGGPPARFLKKAVAARWIASVSSVRRALRAWPAV